MAVNPQQNQMSPDQQQQTATGQSYNQDPGLQTNSQGQRQQGTGFTNINRVLSAGQGAGQQLGQTIGQGVGQQANQFQAGLGQSQQQFGQGVGQNTYGSDDQKKVTDTINSITSPGQTAAGAQKAGADANAQQFQQYLAGGYSGPQQLGNTQQLGMQATNLQQLGQSSPQSLLQQFVGKGQYTQGQQGLDALLLGQQGQQGLQQARAQASGASQQLNQANTEAQQQVQSAALRNKAFGQQALGQLTGASGDIDTSAQQAAKQATESNKTAGLKAQDLSTALQKGLTSGGNTDELAKLIQNGTLTAQDFANMGVNINQLAGDIDLGRLSNIVQANQAAQTVNAGQMLTPVQRAQLQALQNLGGNKFNLPSDITAAQLQNQTAYTPQSFYDQSKADAANIGTLTNEKAAIAAMQSLVDPSATTGNFGTPGSFRSINTSGQVLPQSYINALVAGTPGYATTDPTVLAGVAAQRAMNAGGTNQFSSLSDLLKNASGPKIGPSMTNQGTVRTGTGYGPSTGTKF